MQIEFSNPFNDRKFLFEWEWPESIDAFFFGDIGSDWGFVLRRETDVGFKIRTAVEEVTLAEKAWKEKYTNMCELNRNLIAELESYKKILNE